jgi:crotonobetainyl-CoA:carnitine CoA-transferase CaiB-like acyl-CoA transferase
VEALQRADVAAAVVHSGPSLSRDPHVLARGVFETVDHPILGETRVVRPPWKMDGAKVPGPAPLLGQHNEYVLKEILGLEAPEIEALVESEVVY